MIRVAGIFVVTVLWAPLGCGSSPAEAPAPTSSDAGSTPVADAAIDTAPGPTACANGTYASGAACLACSGACSSGTYLTAACSATADRACGACAPISNCAALTCSTSADASCAACNAGFSLIANHCIGPLGEQAYLKAANAGVEDHFGQAVAVSGDTIVVGAYGESSNETTITNGATASADNSASGAGAAYVYTRTGSSWTEQAYLKAANARSNHNFGYAVAVSGDTIVVGARQESSNQTTITNGATASADNSAQYAGAAYVYARTGNDWTEQAYLKAANADALDSFGGAVAVSGDTIVVGASHESSNQTTITNGATASANNLASNVGAAYVFTRSGTSWTEQAYLKAANADAYDYFGASVAIAGETIVVGAFREASNQTTITNGETASADNSVTGAGAAYVYARSGTNWAQQAYLKAANAGTDDAFGASVAVSGDTIVVGAGGESSNQTTVTNGATASADDSANHAGAAYVYARSGTNWTEQAYLKAANAGAGDAFGAAVAVSGDMIVVGAFGEASNQTTITNGATASADNSAFSVGAAYVYTRSGTDWSEQAYVKAANANAYDYFGYSVAVSGDTIVVGAHGESSNQTTITNGATASTDNSASNAGAAYVFTH